MIFPDDPGVRKIKQLTKTYIFSGILGIKVCVYFPLDNDFYKLRLKHAVKLS